MTALRRGAIIGFGNVAAHGHVPGWLGREDFCIVAVVDPDPQRQAAAAAVLEGVHVYDSVEALLAQESLDFVDVAAPPAGHVPAILAAAAAGVHVLCEKPLAISLVEYQRIRTAVRRAGIVVHTVHNWKYSEAFRTVGEIVATGALGPLREVCFETSRNGCAAASGDNWRMNPAVAGGGILVDHGWHAFYLLLALAQERPLQVRATVERRRYVDAAVEDTARCAIDFPSLTGEIRLTWAARERRTRWQIVGQHGELVIDDDALTLRDGGAPQTQRLSSALSASSHHPDWFNGVIDEFRRELDDTTRRGGNQAEAELCLLLLHQAYASSAQQARPLPIPVWADAAEDGPPA
jgi:predicted dehydrogenase